MKQKNTRIFADNLNSLDNSLRNKVYLRYFFIILLITLGCLMFFTILSSLLMIIFSGTSPDEQQPVWVLKMMQVVLMAGIFGGSSWLAGKMLHFKYLKVYGISYSPPVADYFFSLMLFVILIPFLQWTIAINEQMTLPDWLSSVENWMRSMEEQLARQTESFLKMNNFSDLLINMLIIAIVPAFFEELFFRGLIQSFLLEWFRKPWVAILLTSLFFSGVHLQFYGFLPRFILGLVLGYLFYYSGSLWLSVFFHFTNNALSIVFSYLEQHHFISNKFEEQMSSSYLLVIISLAVVAAVMIYFAVYYDKRRDKSKDWVKVFETENNSEAEIIAGKIENSGIPVSLINKKDSSFTTFGMLEIYVSPENVSEAKRIIHEDLSETQPE
ncbi:MAG TPA: CPBP family glutamic-type intramembrane protease [Bacteroidia bacterium]|nr:CPBP family glutamic-type intramembrane protease [Bacteroidia bacterium]HRS58610.1 CPBP family glutamic-type intramembrane protease [Bacteroidia bacterium]HRU68023.1 CPBP family glutamic-type intramembrane protease [Bacteroidia bacterium]